MGKGLKLNFCDSITDIVYHGKAADTWAMGITLYYMVVGCYPFIGDGILDTYDKVNNSNHDNDSSTWYSFLILVIYILSLLQIVNTPLSFPKELDPELKDLLQGLLCKGDSHYFFTIPSCWRIPLEISFCEDFKKLGIWRAVCQLFLKNKKNFPNWKTFLLVWSFCLFFVNYYESKGNTERWLWCKP